MKYIRNLTDAIYPIFRTPLFFLLNPNQAHRAFTSFAQLTTFLGLEKLLLDHPTNHQKSLIPISNAAGLNKNGDIPPSFFYHLGFDRIVIGTITGEPYPGNPEQNIERFPVTESMVNWQKLPGKGASEIRTIMSKYQSPIPITINLMPTPNSKDPLSDLEKTIAHTKDITQVDRYELNISCPNTQIMSDFCETLNYQLKVINRNKHKWQSVMLKLSPDTSTKDSNNILSKNEINTILETAESLGVTGYTTTNTTRYHDPKFIPNSPRKGGASGNAVYERSLEVQKRVYKDLKKSKSKIIACGGTNSYERLFERINNGASEIQIYTPLIFNGPKLLTKLRSTYHFPPTFPISS
jgi:dihydroorotate dehydrogenase